MKKLIYLIVLTLIIGLFLTGCSLLSNIGQVPATEQSGINYLTKGAGDEGSAESYTLYAGKDNAVGVVKVWNDTDKLYVKYILDDPWCLMETHLHVGTELSDIPQTKKGNPIPGKFDYKMEHNCAPYYTYSIDMPLVSDDELYIAAHAKVSGAPKNSANGVMYATRALTGGTKGLYEIDVITGSSIILVPITGGSADVDNGTGYTNGLAYDPFNQKLYFTAPINANASSSPLWSYDINTGELTKLTDLTGSVVGASFYDGAYYYIAEKTNQLMKIEVNSLGYPSTAVCSGFGTASDFTFGDFAISRRGILYGSTRVFPQMFFSLDLASCEYHEFDDSNALDLQLAYGSDGKLYGINHASGNSYEIDVETGEAIPISFNFIGAADLASGELGVPTTESAWAATVIGELPFDGNNWATYFTYNVKSWKLVGEISVFANTSTPITSVEFKDGEEYKIVAIGKAFAGDTIWFDAKYSNSTKYSYPIDAWTDAVAGYENYGLGLLELKVNGEFVDWGAYNNEHTYTIYKTGTGTLSNFELVIYDIYYPNNSGAIDVSIYQWM